MATTTDIPTHLMPDQQFGNLGVFKLTRLWKTVSDFAKDFAIGQDVALVSVLAGLAHSVGSLVRTSTTFGSIEPPFSLLLVTPERNPVWPEVPVRFLTHEFEASMRLCLETYLRQRQMEGCKKGEEPSDTSLKDTADLADRLCVDGMVERITTNSVLFPFPRSLIDNHVLITTPPGGLHRALHQLQSLQKYQLENALSTGSRLVAPDGIRSSGVPSFYWQIARDDLAPLLRDNPWFAGVPGVILETAKPGAAFLDPSKGSAAALLHLSKDLVTRRHAAMGKGQTIYTDGKTFQPYRNFLKVAQASEVAEDSKAAPSARSVAELGMKFTALLTLLEKKRQPDSLEVNLGLELAKRVTRHRLRFLDACPGNAASNDVNLDGLSTRDRAVFLRIVEREGLSKTELGRSFSRMRKDERDGILTKLVTRNLVTIDAGNIYLRSA